VKQANRTYWAAREKQGAVLLKHAVSKKKKANAGAPENKEGEASTGNPATTQ
jgi:hypothetical protein